MIVIACHFQCAGRLKMLFSWFQETTDADFCALQCFQKCFIKLTLFEMLLQTFGDGRAIWWRTLHLSCAHRNAHRSFFHMYVLIDKIHWEYISSLPIDSRRQPQGKWKRQLVILHQARARVLCIWHSPTWHTSLAGQGDVWFQETLDLDFKSRHFLSSQGFKAAGLFLQKTCFNKNG